MKRALLAGLFLVAALGLAGAARAEAPAALRPARVRASHRVDVIAPGERVETIIDRLRAGAAPKAAAPKAAAPKAAAPKAAEVKPPDRQSVRGPDGARRRERAPGPGHPPANGSGPPGERPRK